MNYKVLKSCRIDNKSVSAGSVISVPEKDVRDLLAMGRIVPHDEPVAENRSVGLEHSDEKPKRRGRPKKEDLDG